MAPSEESLSKVQALRSQLVELMAFIPPSPDSDAPPIPSGRTVRTDISQDLLNLTLEVRLFVNAHEEDMHRKLESGLRKVESEVSCLKNSLHSIIQWDAEVESAEVLETMLRQNDINMTNEDEWWREAAQMLEHSVQQLVQLRIAMISDRMKLAYVSGLWAIFKVRILHASCAYSTTQVDALSRVT